MEIITINRDMQGIRILGAGGLEVFKEHWMIGKNINYQIDDVTNLLRQTQNEIDKQNP